MRKIFTWRVAAIAAVFIALTVLALVFCSALQGAP